MTANIYMRPTPYLNDTDGSLSGYIPPNVLTDESGDPILDDAGNRILTDQ